MVRILMVVFFSLLLPTFSWAVTLGENNIQYIGGPPNTNPGRIAPGSDTTSIVLVGGSNSSVSGNAFPWQQAGSTFQGAYQVPVGSTLHADGIWVKSSAAGANAIGLGQATAGVALGASGTATPMAGIIYYSAVATGLNAATASGGGIYAKQTAATDTDEWIPLHNVTFSASYYPFWHTDQNAAQISVRMTGHLTTP